MFRRIVETIAGGAIGLAALYTVATISFSAGYDSAERRIPDEKVEKVGKLGLFASLAKASRKTSVLGSFSKNPEDHKIEAYVEDGEIHITVRKKKSA